MHVHVQDDHVAQIAANNIRSDTHRPSHTYTHACMHACIHAYMCIHVNSYTQKGKPKAQAAADNIMRVVPNMKVCFLSLFSREYCGTFPNVIYTHKCIQMYTHIPINTYVSRYIDASHIYIYVFKCMCINI